VFSAFLPAGHHQLLIYSPKTKRAFFKQVFVEINQVDFCPTKSFAVKKQRKYASNVWLPLPEETDDARKVAFHHDISNPNFDLELFIKDKDDAKDCLEVLKKNFYYVQEFYIQCMTTSQMFPEVEWIAYLSLFEQL